MTTLRAPYNFVPLPKQVFFPIWADQVSQDIPFADGESGVIELEITNVAPLFTRNGNKRDASDEEKSYSSHVVVNGQKKYFIPATTLKGCFRSVMEILSFAKMGQYNNSSFGMQRIFDTDKTDGREYVQKMENLTCGWLIKKDDNKYEFIECKKGIIKIPHEKIKEKCPTFNEGQNHRTAFIKQNSIADNEKEGFFPFYELDGITYRIVCTGYMGSKKNEYLFSEECKQPIVVTNDVFKAFDTIHERTEYYYGKDQKDEYGKIQKDTHCLRYRLQEYGKIPVFAEIENGKVKAIGITRYFRYPYESKVESGIKNISSELLEEKCRDLPETIFGYIDGEKSIKGRVSFGNAFCLNTIQESQLIEVSGVLGQPAASYYPLYIEQDRNGTYRTYSDPKISIAGRKRYRIGENTINLPQNENNKKVQSTFRALPQGQHFKCKIIFHNLKPIEIGALLSSITLNHTEGCFLNLGLAKSFGYGKITTVIKLKGLKYDESYYCKEFEKALYLNGFDITNNTIWNTFAAISSEHDEEEMGMMKLNEYTDNKKNQNYNKLSESPKTLNIYTTKEELDSLLEQRNAIVAEKQKKRAEKERIRKQQEAEKQIQKFKEQEEKRQKELEAEAAKRQKEIEEKEKQEKIERQEKEIADLVDIANKHIVIENFKEALKNLEKANNICNELNISNDEIQKLIEKCKNSIGEIKSLDVLLADANNIGRIITLTKQWVRDSGQEIRDIELSLLLEAIRRTNSQNQLKSKQKDLIKIIGEENAKKIFNSL